VIFSQPHLVTLPAHNISSLVRTTEVNPTRPVEKKCQQMEKNYGAAQSSPIRHLQVDITFDYCSEESVPKNVECEFADNPTTILKASHAYIK
jgi:hypothetical protein